MCDSISQADWVGGEEVNKLKELPGVAGERIKRYVLVALNLIWGNNYSKYEC